MIRHVLVVEPDDVLRAEVCEFLSERGHRVERVSSPREAMVRLRFSSFEAVLLNLDGPGGWGRASLRELAARAAPPAVVVVTASPAAGAEAVRLGARTFFVRPFSLDEVEGALAGSAGARPSAGGGTPGGLRWADHGAPDGAFPVPAAPSRKLHRRTAGRPAGCRP